MKRTKTAPPPAPEPWNPDQWPDPEPDPPVATDPAPTQPAPAVDSEHLPDAHLDDVDDFVPPHFGTVAAATPPATQPTAVGDDDRDSAAGPDPGDRGHERLLALGVEVGVRLVEDQEAVFVVAAHVDAARRQAMAEAAKNDPDGFWRGQMDRVACQNCRGNEPVV